MEDENCHSNAIIEQENKLFRAVCGDTSYISWWTLSDRHPLLISICENMVRIICQTNLLKSDDDHSYVIRLSTLLFTFASIAYTFHFGLSFLNTVTFCLPYCLVSLLTML